MIVGIVTGAQGDQGVSDAHGVQGDSEVGTGHVGRLVGRTV